MGQARSKPRGSGGWRNLWQFPLLFVSLGLFIWAAILLIDPKAGPTVDDNIATARTLLQHERPDAAIDLLNKLLSSSKLDKPHEGTIHLILSEAIAAAQNQKDAKIRIPRKDEQIIQQINLALADDVKPSYEIHRRLAESYEMLGDPNLAIQHYRSAAVMDPDHSLRIARKIIDLQLANDEASAGTSLDDYLARKDLSQSERAWALGESAHLAIDHNKFTDAREMLAEAAKLSNDQSDQGQLNYWLGYCAWKLRDLDEADRLLRLARDEMRGRHPLDGDAAYLLGRMAADKKDWKVAISFFEVVLTNHPESRTVPLAKLGRGVSRIEVADDDAGLTDLHDLVNQLNQRAPGKIKFGDEVLQGLRDAGQAMTQRGNYQGALELLAYEQDIQPQVPPQFFARLSSVYEKRADQLQKISTTAKTGDQLRMQQESHDLETKAGDASIAYSRALTVTDDKGYGDALWHGIDLYDQVGDLQRSAAALQVFISERPQDPMAPDALLHLGRAYQAMGQYDDAIAAFQKNILRHPNSLAASKSAVPLAQAYMAKGPEFYPRAEATLQQLMENPLITPKAEEFKQSLFDLAQLYYRTGRYEEARDKLAELNDRYPNDEKSSQVLFLMADSYRKSAHLLGTDTSATQPTSQPAVDPSEILAAKKERLQKAGELYQRVIAAYANKPPVDDMDKLYVKLSHFYRGDCAYDLGDYDQAIHLYNTAAGRYQDDASTLSAYVQIVNSYCALGKFDEARAANQRAQVLLKRIPQETFADGSFSLPKEYWSDWLKWTGDSGLWK
jgi:tetratricopeptide (TPR) repeat protein